MENNTRKVFVINNFDNQGAEILFNFSVRYRKKRKGAELHMTYQNISNNTYTNIVE